MVSERGYGTGSATKGFGNLPLMLLPLWIRYHWLAGTRTESRPVNAVWKAGGEQLCSMGSRLKL